MPLASISYVGFSSNIDLIWYELKNDDAFLIHVLIHDDKLRSDPKQIRERDGNSVSYLIIDHKYI